MNQTAFNQLDSNFSVFPDHPSYIDGCLERVTEKLPPYDSIPDFKNDLALINAYKHINVLEDPKNLLRLEDKTLHDSDYIKAWKCILDGKLFTEHFAAGEATRLKLGTKYLININQDLSIDKIGAMIAREKGSWMSEDDILKQSKCPPSDLLSLSLGVRHMLQYAYDIYKLSKTLGYDPNEVLSKQKMLIVLNEGTVDIIIDEFVRHQFYGFDRHNVFFMIQKAYHGINLKNNTVFYDPSTPRHLHNHGHIAIQQTMSNQIFYINEKTDREYLDCDQFGDILKDMEIKISYNIEDLDYLTGSIDHEGLALAIKKRKEGYNMLMEVVPNNPEAPQKGGMMAFDPILGHDVMLESFQLNGIENRQIKYLNKNVNYYPDPYITWEMVKEQGLHLHITVKDGGVYFQPVIGDINFLVKTAFFARHHPHPIKAWKSSVTTPLAINCMHMQDLQKGFKAYARLFINGLPLPDSTRKLSLI